MRAMLMLVLTSFLLQGCVMLTPPQGKKEVTVTLAAPSVLPEAAIGMKREDVSRLLDRPVTVGYERDEATGEFRPLTSRALHSTELIPVNGLEYEVDWYIVAGKKPAGPGEGGLFPLIYQKDVLVGKGPEELAALKARMQ